MRLLRRARKYPEDIDVAGGCVRYVGLTRWANALWAHMGKWVRWSAAGAGGVGIGSLAAFTDSVAATICEEMSRPSSPPSPSSPSRPSPSRDRTPAHCFIAGTPVPTRSALVAIESIRPGDEVLSWNQETGTFEYRKVIELYSSAREDLVVLDGGDWSVTCSSNHRFLLANGLWRRARELEVGDQIMTGGPRAESIVSKKVLGVPGGRPVFNLEVDETHTYCVTRAKLVVHNFK